MDLQPLAEQVGRNTRDRYLTRFPALPGPNRHHPIDDINIVDPDCGAFAAPQPAVDEEGEERAVTPPYNRVRITRIEQRLDLLVIDVASETARVAAQPGQGEHVVDECRVKDAGSAAFHRAASEHRQTRVAPRNRQPTEPGTDTREIDVRE